MRVIKRERLKNLKKKGRGCKKKWGKIEIWKIDFSDMGKSMSFSEKVWWTGKKESILNELWGLLKERKVEKKDKGYKKKISSSFA